MVRSLKVPGGDGKKVITLDMRARKRLVQLWNTQVWAREEKKIEDELSDPGSKASRLFSIMSRKANVQA
ncbi:MAG TPA: hypothetical protein VJA40_06045 [archaeon]|nr:hypothetical protein [archaeon]